MLFLVESHDANGNKQYEETETTSLFLEELEGFSAYCKEMFDGMDEPRVILINEGEGGIGIAIDDSEWENKDVDTMIEELEKIVEGIEDKKTLPTYVRNHIRLNGERVTHRHMVYLVKSEEELKEYLENL